MPSTSRAAWRHGLPATVSGSARFFAPSRSPVSSARSAALIRAMSRSGVESELSLASASKSSSASGLLRPRRPSRRRAGGAPAPRSRPRPPRRSPEAPPRPRRACRFGSARSPPGSGRRPARPAARATRSSRDSRPSRATTSTQTPMMSRAEALPQRLQLIAPELLVDLADECFGAALVVGHSSQCRKCGGNARDSAPPNEPAKRRGP